MKVSEEIPENLVKITGKSREESCSWRSKFNGQEYLAKVAFYPWSSAGLTIEVEPALRYANDDTWITLS